MQTYTPSFYMKLPTYTYFFSKVVHPTILLSTPTMSAVIGPSHVRRALRRSATLAMNELIPLEKSSSVVL